MRFAFALVTLSFVAVCACANGNALPPTGEFDTGEDGAAPDSGAVADSGACTSGSFVAASLGGSGDHDDGVSGVAVDADESTWIVGTFVGRARWGDIELAAADSVQTTGFVAKFDAAGKIVFAHAIGQTTPDNPSVASRVRVDAAGNVFVAGTFGGALDYDDVHLTTTRASAAFVLALDTTGKALWGAASTSTTGSGESARDVAVDANGDVYLVGSYDGQAVFGTFALDLASRARAPFVAKYSPTDHAWIWARGFSGVEDNSGGVANGVSVAPDGQSVYAVGQTASAMDVDGRPFLVSGGGFFLRLAASDGHTIWATVAAPSGASDVACPHAATVDAEGNLYVAGEFSGTLRFDAAEDDATASNDAGGVSVTATGGRNVFVARYDLSGTPAWVERAGQGSVARGDDIAFDGANALYVSGYKEGILAFGGVSLASTGNAFVARYDTSGHAVWAAGDNSSDLSTSEAVAIGFSPTSGVVAGGTFAKTTSFGAWSLTSSGENDGFVVHMCNYSATPLR